MSNLKHKLLHISSRHLTTGTNSNFTVHFNNSDGVQSVVSLIVKQISIPNVFYNIRDSNRSFTYRIATVPTTVQIAAGQYTSAQLITALQNAVAGLTITQDQITKKLIFSGTAREYLNRAAGNAMADVLGITTSSVGDVNNFTAQGLLQLEGLHNIYINSQELAQSNLIRSDNQGTLNTIAVIPVTQPFGGIIQYIGDSAIDDFDATSQRLGKPIQRVSISVEDQDGNILDLQNHHITITMKMYYM